MFYDKTHKKSKTCAARKLYSFLNFEARDKSLYLVIFLHWLFRGYQESLWVLLKWSQVGWLCSLQVAASTNRGRDLIGVQNLIKKQQALIAEITNHESQVGRRTNPTPVDKWGLKCFALVPEYSTLLSFFNNSNHAHALLRLTYESINQIETKLSVLRSLRAMNQTSYLSRKSWGMLISIRTR